MWLFTNDTGSSYLIAKDDDAFLWKFPKITQQDDEILLEILKMQRCFLHYQWGQCISSGESWTKIEQYLFYNEIISRDSKLFYYISTLFYYSKDIS